MDKEIMPINASDSIEKVRALVVKSPAYIFMKLFSRIYFLRVLSSYLSKKRNSYPLNVAGCCSSDAIELTDGYGLESIVRELRDTGYSLGINLSPVAVSDILKYAQSNQVYAYGDPSLGFDLTDKAGCELWLNKEILIAKYYNFHNLPIFKDIIESSLVKEIAAAYLGKTAKPIATQLWWTFPAEVDDRTRSQAAHYFHRDVDAWGFVKFFFYLTDVGEGGGPHVFVRGSHRPKLWQQFFRERLRVQRQPDTKVRTWFGDESVTPIYGEAGVGFVADTFAFHKGQSPDIKSRLLLCLVYAREDYGEQDSKVDPQSIASYN